MRPTRSLLCCSVLLLHAGIYAQHPPQVLSFEPGGQEICANDVGLSIPTEKNSPPEFRSFEVACARRDIEIEQAEFAKFSRAMSKRGAREAKAFRNVMAAFDAFRSTFGSYYGAQVCGGGIGCGAEMGNQEAWINYGLLKMLEGFPRDGLPHFDAEDFAKENASLNAWYKQAQDKAIKETCNDPADVKGCQSEATDPLRNTQRAWLRYREAWVVFGAVLWPQVSADSWRTYLTKQRLKWG